MDDKMKILMTTDTVGGVWTYVMSLCKCLEHYNVEIHLLSMGGMLSEEQQAQVNAISCICIYQSSFKLEWMQSCERDVQSAREWVAFMYNKIRPDIIHFNNFGQTLGSWNCPVITVYHSCVISWWIAVKGENPPPEWGKYIQAVRNTIEVSDVIVAPSHSMLEQARTANGDFKNAKVIYNGLDSPSEYIGEKEYIVLTAGRIWDEAKNIKMLLKTAKHIEWPVYIAGNHHISGTPPVSIVENVHFLGHLTHKKLQHYMRRASIFVMPAQYEPFGLSVLEAARSSCALILADIPSFREIWGDAAVYFDQNEEVEIQKALQNLIADEELRVQISQRAYERSLDFSAQKMAGNYMQLYEELLMPVSRK